MCPFPRAKRDYSTIAKRESPTEKETTVLFIASRKAIRLDGANTATPRVKNLAPSSRNQVKFEGRAGTCVHPSIDSVEKKRNERGGSGQENCTIWITNHVDL